MAGLEKLTHEVVDANFREFGSVFEGTKEECYNFIQKQSNQHNLVVRSITNSH